MIREPAAVSSEGPASRDAMRWSAKVLETIDRACEPIRHHPEHAADLAALEALAVRLSAGRFQLAVLGQFKRGKSTLLNALVGEPILPVSAVPATAVATFVVFGVSPELTLAFKDGRTEHRRYAEVGPLASDLAAVVTEEGNPRNALGLARVDVAVPSPFLSGGVVLIDTPGIGSTHLHNSDAARAALPECDAALLVLSADLPITEAEASFAGQVRAAAAEVIVVMTKKDAVQEEDAAAVTAFSTARLGEILGAASHEPAASVVSAKQGLRAKRDGDAAALAKSGMLALERRIEAVLARGKRGLLARAIAAKAAQVVGHARSGCDLRLAALRLPVEEIDRKAALIEAAVTAFERERAACRDLLAGERRRCQERLAAACGGVEERARHIRPAWDASIQAARTADAANDELVATVGAFFDAVRSELLDGTGRDVDAAITAHRERLDAIADWIASEVGEIMGVHRHAPVPAEELLRLREPYWVGTVRIDSLGSLTVDGVASVLPRPVREARARRKLLAGVDAAVVRNLSNLQWAVSQALDDTFRSLERQRDGEIAADLSAARDALDGARRLRAGHVEKLRRNERDLGDRRERLKGAEAELWSFDVDAFSPAQPDDGGRRAAPLHTPSLVTT